MTVTMPSRFRRRLYGATPPFTFQGDPRFAYYLYVPSSAPASPPRNGYPLVVAVTGVSRQIDRYRTGLIEFAERQQCIVLLPLFPVGVAEPYDLTDYTRIESNGVRFDEALLGMVDEISTVYPVRGPQFLLHGYSGGGQFAHRFLYLHPERVAAVSIGAPGTVTLLDNSLPWWVGTGGFVERFGVEPDLAAIAAVPVLLSVGADDTDPNACAIEEDEPLWMPGINDTGTTRVERLRTLRDNLDAAGLQVRLVEVPGVGHAGTQLFAPVTEFFAEQLPAYQPSR